MENKQIEIEDKIERLRKFSLKLNEISNDKNELVKQLNSISIEKRSELFAKYQFSTGPITGIRKEVAIILKDRNISLNELTQIVEQYKLDHPNSFLTMYQTWFNILYMFLIADFKSEMKNSIESISNYLINLMELQDEVVAKKFDFTGERETGSTRCWIAIINKTHISQTTAKQLFINIQNGEFEYCIYDRPNDRKIDAQQLQPDKKVNIESVFELFNNKKQIILEDKFIPKINYWRIGSKDNNQSYWDEMKSENKVCIGWAEIGDLGEQNVRNRKEIIKLLDNEGFYVNNNQVKSRKAGEIYNFYEKIKINDIISVQDGETILGIGRVTSEYFFNIDSNFPHQKSVDWLCFNPNFYNNIGNQTTCYQIEDINKINEIVNAINYSNPSIVININSKKTQMTQPLNQILYGPPGTGKTFNSINRAIMVIENLSEEELRNNYKAREELKDAFDRYIDKKQIAFTTFHQSMSYEDFIEGIKPLEPEIEKDPIHYSVEEGIFKTICIHAAFEYFEQSTSISSQEALTFSQKYDNLVQEIENTLSQGKKYTLDSKSGLPIEIVEITDNGNISLKHENGNRNYIVSKKRVSKLNAEIDDLESVNNIHQHFKSLIGGSNATAYWTVLNKIRKINNDLPEIKLEIKEFSFSEKIELVETLKSEDFKNKKAKPYVLIIDEINRGNISAIFGELITLIEENKRQGKPEALKIMLPYSKKEFSVPPNVYIVGTMNTADRSVEALDTALRRRFTFEEIPPNENLDLIQYPVFDTTASAILKTLNARIEKLLDKDHKLGHSFFIKKDSDSAEEKIVETFYKNIIPLLQEYFFGDFGKIGLVLGKRFVTVDNSNESIFADFDYESKEDYQEKEIYSINDFRINNDMNGFKDAIKILMTNK
jgi:5-methylcytosine-specific restriction endonuclease McrBC GTP-binding regulatory subunit McrB